MEQGSQGCAAGGLETWLSLKGRNGVLAEGTAWAKAWEGGKQEAILASKYRKHPLQRG